MQNEITTDLISLDRNHYFSILLQTRVLNIWYAYLFPLPLAVGFYIYDSEDTTIVKFLVVFGLIYPAWTVFYLWRHAISQHKKGAASPRHYTINSSSITTHLDGEAPNEIPLANLLLAKETKTDFLLYLNKGKFIVIPKNSIQNQEAQLLKNWLQQVNKI